MLRSHEGVPDSHQDTAVTWLLTKTLTPALLLLGVTNGCCGGLGCPLTFINAHILDFMPKENGLGHGKIFCLENGEEQIKCGRRVG